MLLRRFSAIDERKNGEAEIFTIGKNTVRLSVCVSVCVSMYTDVSKFSTPSF